MPAWYMLSVSVCPSVRLSVTGSHKQRHTIAQGLVFWYQISRRNSNGITPNVGAK